MRILRLDIAPSVSAGGVAHRETAGATPLVAPMRVKAPRLAPLAGSRRVAGGLLLSALLHTSAVASVFWLHLALPGTAAPREDTRTNAELIHDPDLVMLPLLPAIKDQGSAHDVALAAAKHIAAPANPITRRRPSPDVPAPDLPAPDLPSDSVLAGAPNQPVRPRVPVAPIQKPNSPHLAYADSQVIVSQFPDATNTVQTITMPDLPAPPKQPFPVLLPSMVMRPSRSASANAVPQQEAPQLAGVPLQTSQLALSDEPKLAAPVGQPIAAPITKAPSTVGESAAPQIGDPNASKSLVVINAVNVPPAPVAPLPSGELHGNFAVGPSDGPPGTAAEPGTSPKSAGESKVVSSSTPAAEGGLPPTRSLGPAGAANSGAAHAPTPAGPESSSGRNSGGLEIAGAAGSGGSPKGVPGISISGGAPARAAGARTPLAPSTSPVNPYSLTIISGGNSGGVTRDLGVFSRGETVYTVYIPMADLANVADFPMEYSLADPADAAAGLPTPPVALTKILPTGRKADLGGDSALVYIAGTIDENGAPQYFRGVPTTDQKSWDAVRAISQWAFKPAQLNGKAVASKVLIGVTVVAIGGSTN